jgi:hypothetical protein
MLTATDKINLTQWAETISPQHPKAMSYEAIVITREALLMKYSESHTQEEIKNYILNKINNENKI